MSQESRPKPYAPRGAVDGIVCDTALAKKMSFIGKFGSSCDIGFNKTEFCKKHRQYEKFFPYLKDRPSYSWTEFTILNKKNGKIKTTKNRNHSKNKTVKNKRKKKGKMKGKI